MNSNASQFFYEITPDVVLDAVEELEVKCTGKMLALNSVENRVYDVELIVDNPDDLKSRYEASRIIKFYRPGRWTKEQILEEHQFIKDLKNQELPVVAPLEFPDGSTLHSVKTSNDSEVKVYFSVFPKIGGRIIDEFTDSQIEFIGRLIARVHQVARSRQAEHRIHLNINTFGRDNGRFLLENNILPPAISDRYMQLVDNICSISEPWFERVPVHRLHGDCHIGNILWQDQTCNLVDFDDFCIGPAIQDLWLIVAGRDDWNLKQRDLLLNAYSQITQFDYETIRLIEPLRALRMIHFSAWIARRWEDPSFKNLFLNFGSQQYWREELIALEEVLQIMQCGEIY